ncbi:hypothetical protein BHE74_00013873 [Ensete ventricosum]|nr:hypothetical protein BHE74_00013873 [Ensete ventricosum]RZR86379.1 hypothetical protein BHM03_00013556 [Ensete ventricosum]
MTTLIPWVLSCSRQQAGVYTSYLYGPKGKQVKYFFVQVISNLSATTGPLFHTESWGRFPKERARLYKLIHDSKAGHLLSSEDILFFKL